MGEPLKQKNIYKGRVLDLKIETHVMPDGRESDFEVVHHPGGAAVLPVLADGRLLLIRQYRTAVAKVLYEIPAGRLEPGESPQDCAARELREEAGLRAGKVFSLGGLWSTPGFCNEYIYLYFATGLAEAEQQLEPDEFIELFPVALEEALRMVADGDIDDSKTQLALLRYHLFVVGDSQK